jgi:alkanesulfonate monooxygenase SsuD/methylene tetrahydromethanopterin reductase-like flavin-dependent oxidoreductase (luciferase family)
VKRLSARYAQDFGPLAGRYGIIGTPDQCVEQLERFRSAGCRYFVLSTTCEADEDRDQLERIAAEVLPRLRA